MQILLKNTYLLRTKVVEKRLRELWERYQEILKKPNWGDLNEARAILYLVGQIYCEKIAPEAIKRRLHLLKKPLDIVEFLSLVDSKSKRLKFFRKDKLFFDLEKFYITVKEFKNKFNSGKYYLDEEKFIKIYNKYNPDKTKIGYRGNFKINKRRRSS